MEEQACYKIRIIPILIFLFLINPVIFPQTGLTIEKALHIAEENSPNMKKTRLNLIRNQELA